MNAGPAPAPGEPAVDVAPGGPDPGVDGGAGPGARGIDALLADVARQPWAHDFFALVRRLDALHPDAPRTGRALRPGQEPWRLTQLPELDFAPAAIGSFDRPAGRPPRLGVRFLGLLGPQGPMPLHFTEYVRDRVHHHGDRALAHFLDLFHHRVLALFYRAWAQGQPVVHRDRPQDDRYIAWLRAVAGLPPGIAGVLTADALAFQAGLLSSRSRHPEAMLKTLRQYFGVPIAFESNVGEWLEIEPAQRSQLGFARNRAERSERPEARLGRTANAGCRVWDRQYRFRLHVGPLTLAQYRAFLPGGTAWPALQEWVRLLAGPTLRWDAQLMLAAGERPEPKLGRVVQLGLTSWLGRRAASRQPARQHLRLRPKPVSSPLHGGGPDA
jgi:type VI secretion system protein ImpH